ncbi:hypothetical protein BU24DRAFT_135171 [Aaosphaeria arxii CBS 175.79]|uniref:DUF1365-domain-containing protein n=1 Tax=Aaosphaeria arxii CBS 175.79 TaxID=1450172 RepID=A0A6A5Y6K5_9PLEO|nr:uncharacterized protein BU24DRAFT_135171 [Aaosphaeria arxii CBS 175.79]KAF2020194.1 hypothetical protein BU24DRAFT_135171 [Aaosphaeria arxii CBS 175.79]
MVGVSHSRRGNSISLALCFLAVLPLAAEVQRAAWPLLLLWVGAGGVRWWYGDETLRADCVVFGGIALISAREGLWNWTSTLSDSVLGIVWDGAVIRRASTIVLIVLGFVSTSYKNVFKRKEERPGSDSNTTDSSIKHPKALIFPCRTTHARIFPKRHAFKYSYLLYGIPIIPPWAAANGQGIVDGKDRKKGNWWLQVRAEDYLERGYGELGFYGKLKKVLHEHDVPDSEWSYAYLVTAPRFLGYSFNPVSFWYVYNSSHELKRMILEVNNTFGERRMYVLDGASPPTPPQTPDEEMPKLQIEKASFTDAWQKDFHVSPFNSRKGSYSLKATNPFPGFPAPCAAKIDNTITLKSSKDHAKIVARVYSIGTALDANTLGAMGTLRFVGGWWWVGLVTFPRILKEAFRLFFKRSLNVWFRPEVLSSSIGRAHTSEEKALQEILHSYLQHLVWNSSEQWDITYHTAIPSRPTEKVMSTHVPGRNIPCKKLEIRVLTPAFYSRFVHYSYTWEAFDRECLFTDERNRTVWISNPELLALLLSGAKKQCFDYEDQLPRRGRLDEMRWSFMRRLRCPPAEPAYPLTPKRAEFDVNDIRTLPFSDMDKFVRSRHCRFDSGSYRRIVTKTFLAQRFAFGFAEVVDLLDLMIRILLCYLAVVTLMLWTGRDIIRWFTDQKVQHQDDWLDSIKGGLLDIPSCLGTWSLICGSHLYGLAKGYF